MQEKASRGGILTSESSQNSHFFIDAAMAFGFSGCPMQCCAKSPEEMERLGNEAARRAAAGTVIALVGGLGAGKTHWTKGFVRGIESSADVTSPTFGLVHEYRGGRLPVFHFDFYRLNSADELLALGWDEYLESEGVIIAEWGDKFPELLPKETLWLGFGIEPDGSRVIKPIPQAS